MDFKKFIPLFCLSILFTSCGGGDGEPSVNLSSDNTSVNVSSGNSETSSSSFTEIDFSEAIKNTKYYGFKNYSNTVRYYTEIYAEEIYYNTFSRGGYVILDSDPDYLHFFNLNIVHNEENIDDYYHIMHVRGRNALASEISTLRERSIISIIEEYQKTILYKEDNIYRSTSIEFIRAIADFLQQKGLRYCNAIEFTVDSNNRIEHLRMYEEYGNDRAQIIDTIFDEVDYKTLEMYTKWVEGGKVVDPRLADYKFLTENENEVVSLYQNETVEFVGVVSAIDVDGNAYVSKEESNTGNIGIKVTPTANSAFKLNDEVKVRGKVVCENYLTHIENAEIEVIGSVEYPPMFDEERIVDTYGGGYYAYQYFSQSPYYNDSLYSTYAYLSDAPASLSSDGDTYLEVSCPTFGNNFIMQVILPAGLDATLKDELFEALTTNGNIFYDEFPNELCLEKFIVECTEEYNYAIKLIATNDSLVYKKLTPQEKVEKYIGLKDFPVVESDAYTSFRFGEGTSYFLEETYQNYENEIVSGVYIGASDISKEQFDAFIAEIEAYGVEKYDEIKDYFYTRHIIYQIDDVVIDISYSLTTTMDSEYYVLNVWVYKGEILRNKSIEEQLEEKIGDYFNVEDFLRLSGTHDADYTLYELHSYAGTDYSDNPLICVSLDLDENVLSKYGFALVNMGYEVYRNINNKPYSYKTRGQTHSVFVKGDIFIDIASYHTSDYTYNGHDDFEYRLEILIYKGSKPIEIKTYNSLDVLSNLYKNTSTLLSYDITLPDDAVVELWRDLDDWSIVDVDYGYNCRDEAFVYSENIDLLYLNIQEGLLNSGYKLSASGLKSTLFSKTVSGNSYSVLVMQEKDKGYVRVINGVGGVDFI